jgi:tetratricopeptide (TPR) repeat protein
MKDGVRYGVKRGIFGYDYDDFYERGISYQQGECYALAVKDFQKAIQIQAEDASDVRIYGMHYIEYFPHRELGITYFFMGEYAKALTELEKSITDVSTAKAQYYLNQTRKQLMINTVPEKIYIETIAPQILSKADPVMISGDVNCEQFVSEIWINKEPLYVASSQQNIHFTNELSLIEGSHTIAISAKSLNSAYTALTLTVTIDRSGPIISLKKLENNLDINLIDEAGISSLTINEQPIHIVKGNNVHFRQKITPDVQTIHIIAVDQLGNRVVENVNIDLFLSQYYLGHLTATNETGFNSDAEGIDRKKRPQLQISIKKWKSYQTVCCEKISINGQVTGRHSIVSLSINTKNIPVLEGDTILFNRSFKLQYGKNTFLISAKDKKGHRIIQSVTFFRKIKEVYNTKYRYTIKTSPFRCIKYNEPSFLEKFLFDSKGHIEFISSEHQFIQCLLLKKLVDRKRFCYQFQDEFKTLFSHFSLNRLWDNQILSNNAMALMYGRIVETRNGVEIKLKLIETKSMVLLDRFDVFGPKDQLKQMLSKISELLHRKFPLIDAPITSISDRKASVFHKKNNWEATLNWPLIIYRMAEPKDVNFSNNEYEMQTQLIDKSLINEVFKGVFRFGLNKTDQIDKECHVIFQ